MKEVEETNESEWAERSGENGVVSFLFVCFLTFRCVECTLMSFKILTTQTLGSDVWMKFSELDEYDRC